MVSVLGEAVRLLPPLAAGLEEHVQRLADTWHADVATPAGDRDSWRDDAAMQADALVQLLEAAQRQRDDTWQADEALQQMALAGPTLTWTLMIGRASGGRATSQRSLVAVCEDIVRAASASASEAGTRGQQRQVEAQRANVAAEGAELRAQTLQADLKHTKESLGYLERREAILRRQLAEAVPRADLLTQQTAAAEATNQTAELRLAYIEVG
jgi:hypothetical protein